MKTNLVHRSIMALTLTLTLGLALVVPSGASAVEVGRTCGGVAGIPCDAGLFCQLPAGMCGVADAQGRCARIPTVCNPIIRPVCGCDKKTYSNDCERQMTKVQKNHDGRCASAEFPRQPCALVCLEGQLDMRRCQCVIRPLHD